MRVRVYRVSRQGGTRKRLGRSASASRDESDYSDVAFTCIYKAHQLCAAGPMPERLAAPGSHLGLYPNTNSSHRHRAVAAVN